MAIGIIVLRACIMAMYTQRMKQENAQIAMNN